MTISNATFAAFVFGVFGAYFMVKYLWRQWLLGCRGEYHCSECGCVSPLPEDDEDPAQWKSKNGGAR